METIITQIIPLVPSAAWPLLLVIALYAYINMQRKSTKAERDQDSQEIHDAILKLQFKVSELDGRTVNHAEILDDLRNQLGILNSNISRLSAVIDMMNSKK